MSTRIYPVEPKHYIDGRPGAGYRLDLKDEGVVFEHGPGPDRCDYLGAREASAFEYKGKYYLHYDGAGPNGWVACLATSTDLRHWDRRGPVLPLGDKGTIDSGSASSPWVYNDGKKWHMFYVATPTTTPGPDFVPALPYYTCKAESNSPSGPWRKRYDIIPFRTVAGTHYSITASPGPVIKHNGEYMMFFSTTCATERTPYVRTLSIARTKNLDGAWAVDPKPMVPIEEQVENASVYFEKKSSTWFLFTNHIGIDEQGGEYTDAIWVYWTKDINHWDASHKAIVLDGANCQWANECIGMPSVLVVKNRLALLYDAAPGRSKSHMRRNIGLAWLELPLTTP
ncbi:MAG: glycoside hydrolase family protein [Armatimonadota bacterium]